MSNRVFTIENVDADTEVTATTTKPEANKPTTLPGRADDGYSDVDVYETPKVAEPKIVVPNKKAILNADAHQTEQNEVTPSNNSGIIYAKETKQVSDEDIFTAVQPKQGQQASDAVVYETAKETPAPTTHSKREIIAEITPEEPVNSQQQAIDETTVSQIESGQGYPSGVTPKTVSELNEEDLNAWLKRITENTNGSATPGHRPFEEQIVLNSYISNQRK